MVNHHVLPTIGLSPSESLALRHARRGVRLLATPCSRRAGVLGDLWPGVRDGVSHALASEAAAQNIALRRELRIAREELRASRDDFAHQKDHSAQTPFLPSIGPRNSQREEFSELLSGAGESTLCLRYLYASPLRVPPLDIDAELKVLQQALAGTMEVLAEVASVSSLGRAATDPDQWIHISAHSGDDGLSLVFEDDAWIRESRILTHAGLVKLFTCGGRPRTTFVFLSACNSAHLAQALHVAGVPHVAFCPTPVADKRARSFADSLYSALAKRMSLEHAFAIARCTAELSGDEAQYGLISDGSLRIHHSSLLSSGLSMQKSATWCQHLKRRIEDFVGRLDVFREIFYYLGPLHRRVVVLHCGEPFGLTATLRECAGLISSPGRKYAGRNACAFFPDEAVGGLLLVDDLDALRSEDKVKVHQHLQVEGAQLLGGCRKKYDASEITDDKIMYVQLPPLKALEAAQLFLRRCQRKLLAEDLLPLSSLGGHDAKNVIAPDEALELLAKPVEAFGGFPGKIRCAVDKWVFEGSPCLHGDPGKLAQSVIVRSERKTGPRWR